MTSEPRPSRICQAYVWRPHPTAHAALPLALLGPAALLLLLLLAVRMPPRLLCDQYWPEVMGRERPSQARESRQYLRSTAALLLIKFVPRNRLNNSLARIFWYDVPGPKNCPAEETSSTSPLTAWMQEQIKSILFSLVYLSMNAPSKSGLDKSDPS